MTRGKKRRGPLLVGPTDEEKAEMLSRLRARMSDSREFVALEWGEPDEPVLCRDAGGLRHYLDGEPVRAGEHLELRANDGAWALVRYEWTFRRGDAPALILEDDRALPHRRGARLRRPKPP